MRFGRPDKFARADIVAVGVHRDRDIAIAYRFGGEFRGDQHMFHGQGRLVAVFALAFSCGGCASSNVDMLHFLREHKNEVSATEYRVGIPDSLAIRAPKIPEIDGTMQRLQPDGKITLALLGEVKVAGLTAKEIAAKLEVLLGRYYVEPSVGVRVVSFASKKYYVYGQVGQAGPRPYTGRDTLLDAVLASGVGLPSWTSRAKVIRPAHGETPVRTVEVNIDRMLKVGDWSQNILLEPNDIVYVPPTPAAWLGHRVSEFLFPIQPVVQAYVGPSALVGVDNAYRNGSGSRASFNGGASNGTYVPR